MEASAAIQIVDLKKVYRENLSFNVKTALAGISFEVPRGQIFGFLGANGSGKTTTIKIAMGLQAASSGRVELLGQPTGNVKVRSRIGFLPERPYFHMNLSADEFLNFHRSLYGPSLEGRRRAGNEELLRLVGLPDVRGLLLRSFSKGMLQRIGMAQALLNDPELIILDEPMSGLDPVGRKELRNLLLELNSTGKTIFFSSHILSDIESLCPRIAFLEKGQLKYCGKVDDLISGSQHDYEIIFRGEKLEKSPEIQALGRMRVSGKQVCLTVSGLEAAKGAVQKLWVLGAEVSGFSPVHRSLEEVLFGADEKRGG